MHKAMFFLNPKEGMEREAFEEYWLDEHAPLAHDTPNLERYTVSFPGGDAEYAGVAELWFEDEGALQEAMNSEAFQAVVQDVPNFGDPESGMQLVVEENIVVG